MKKLLISSLLLLITYTAIGQDNSPEPIPRSENCELLGSSETDVKPASIVPDSVSCNPATGNYTFEVVKGKYTVVDDYEDGCSDVTKTHTTTLLFAGTQEDEEGNSTHLKFQEVSDDNSVRGETTVPLTLCCGKN